MSDIVERLRRGHHNADLITVGGVTHDGRCLVAADEITRLRADLAAAQEREQSRALPADDAEMVEKLMELVEAAYREGQSDAEAGYFWGSSNARAALSAMRGEP